MQRYFSFNFWGIRIFLFQIAANDELAAGSGAKAMGARNLQNQGYGKKELRILDDDMVKFNKKLTKAENSDDIQEPGFLW